MSDTTHYDLTSICHLVRIEPDRVLEYIQLGYVSTTPGSTPAQPHFDDEALYHLRLIQQLREEHHLDTHAIGVMLGLMREIDRLRAEVRFLRPS